MGHKDRLARARAQNRQARRLKRALHILIAYDAGQLAPACFECQLTEADLPSPLEINHIYGRRYRVNKLSVYTRVLRYWREYWAGIEAGVPELNLLCQTCNRRYRPIERPQPGRKAAVEMPF